MKYNYSVELVEEYEKVNFYSIHLEGKELTEMEDFFDKLRLYCLRLSDKILIFGNGGAKDTARWEESEELSSYVKILIDTSRFIASRLQDGSLLLVDKEIIGDLTFTRDEKK